jgi:hypothetical protein
MEERLLSTAGGNITTYGLSSSSDGAGSGGNITLSVTGGTGSINTSAGTLWADSDEWKWRSDRPLNYWWW